MVIEITNEIEVANFNSILLSTEQQENKSLSLTILELFGWIEILSDMVHNVDYLKQHSCTQTRAPDRRINSTTS